MLLNNFFTIRQLLCTDQQIDAELVIQPEHEILKGHFPGQAVVPGVCMLEMLRECIEVALQKKMQLQNASVVKFLTLFTPPLHTEARFVIKWTSADSEHLDADAVLQHQELIFLKIKCRYQILGKQ